MPNVPVKDSKHENVRADKLSLSRPVFGRRVRTEIIDVIVFDGACEINVKSCLVFAQCSCGLCGTEQELFAHRSRVRVLANKVAVMATQVTVLAALVLLGPAQ